MNLSVVPIRPRQFSISELSLNNFLPLVLAACPSEYQGSSQYFSDENHHFTGVSQLDSGSKVIMGFTFW